jgi:hypothetical protein
MGVGSITNGSLLVMTPIVDDYRTALLQGLPA